MVSEYEYDVFVSYSSSDLDQVAEIVERLQADGLRVWFDQQQSRTPGKHFPSEIDQGLNNSLILLFCISPTTVDSDWLKYELGSFRSQDPINRQGRILPIRLEPFESPPSLSVYSVIEFYDRFDDGYADLLEYCRQKVDALKAPNSTGGPKSSETQPAIERETLIARRRALFPRLARPKYLESV